MKLESICPLTTNSSSELFVFMTEDKSSIEELFKDCNGRDFSGCVGLVTQLEAESDSYDSCNSLRAVFNQVTGYGTIEQVENLLRVEVSDVSLASLGEELRREEENDFYNIPDAIWNIFKDDIQKSFKPFVAVMEDNNSLMGVLYGHTEEKKANIHDNFMKGIKNHSKFIFHGHLG